MLVTAVVGIGVNLARHARARRRARRGACNVEGAYQHVLTDLYAFVATALAGAIILLDRLPARPTRSPR